MCILLEIIMLNINDLSARYNSHILAQYRTRSRVFESLIGDGQFYSHIITLH